MSKKGKAAKPAQNKDTNEIGLPVETVESLPLEQTPQTDPMQAAKDALLQEVEAIAQGKDPALVVWRFNKKNGTQVGSSLKFYLDCKMHEIENPESPCDFSSPSGPPTAPSSMPAARGANTPARQPKKCPTCN